MIRWLAWASLALAVEPGASPTKQRMSAHFDESMVLRSAVVAGDLTAAREAAGRLAALGPIPGAAPTMTEPLAKLAAAAAKTRDAQTLMAVAVGTGEIGATCAACHASTGGGPRPGPAEIAAYRPLTDAHAEQLEFASWFMWLGVVSPSDAAWEAAMRPIAAVATLPGPDAESRVALVRRAPVAPAAERPGIYGQLLGTCGSCHAANGVRPGGSVDP